MNKLSAGLVLTLVLGYNGITFAQDTQVVGEGKTVKFEYNLKVDNEVVDSSEGKEPIEYVHGQGKVIPGIEKNLTGLKVGDEKDFTLAPEDAYGQNDPQGIQEVQKSLIPADIEMKPGTVLEMVDASQNVFPAKVVEVKTDTVVLDFNHPLAGKELNFHAKVVDIKNTPPASTEAPAPVTQ